MWLRIDVAWLSWCGLIHARISISIMMSYKRLSIFIRIVSELHLTAFSSYLANSCPIVIVQVYIYDLNLVALSLDSLSKITFLHRSRSFDNFALQNIWWLLRFRIIVARLQATSVCALPKSMTEVHLNHVQCALIRRIDMNHFLRDRCILRDGRVIQLSILIWKRHYWCHQVECGWAITFLILRLVKDDIHILPIKDWRLSIDQVLNHRGLCLAHKRMTLLWLAEFSRYLAPAMPQQI